MENKRYSFGYEDTDKKIEIELYGLVFEINNINEDSEEYYKNIDKEDINKIEKEIEKLLGNGSIEKINKKRESDGYSKLTLDIELSILGCIFEAYSKGSIDKVTNKVIKTNKDITNQITELKNNQFNREQRRNRYNKNYNYKKNRYRRY